MEYRIWCQLSFKSVFLREPMDWHFRGLIHNSILSRKRETESSLVWIFSEASCGFVPLYQIMRLSAYSWKKTSGSVIKCTISLMYKLNKVGLSRLPCDTPLVKLKGLDIVRISIICSLVWLKWEERKLEIQLTTQGLML